MVAHPCHQRPPIAPLDPEPPQLFTGTAEPCEEKTGSSRVGDRGSRDAHGHQEPQRINQQMAFAPFDVFAVVVAAFASEFCRLDALAVDAARRRMLVTPCLLAHPGAEGVVEASPGPAVTPWAEIPVHPGPFRLLMGGHAPFDAPVDDIKNNLDHCSHIEFAVATTRLRGWDQIFDKIPFGISEVCEVWIGVHPQSVLN